VGVGGRLGHVCDGCGGAVARFDGTHGPGLRVGVRDSRNRLVVGTAVIAGDVRRDHVPLVFAHVRQRPDPVHVPDRPQPLTGAQVLINADPVWIGLDPHCLETDPFDPRAPAGGHQQTITPQFSRAVK